MVSLVMEETEEELAREAARRASIISRVHILGCKWSQFFDNLHNQQLANFWYLFEKWSILTLFHSQQSRSSLCRTSKLYDEVEGGEGPSDSDFGPSGLDQGVELRSVEPGFVPDQNQKRWG